MFKQTSHYFYNVFVYRFLLSPKVDVDLFFFLAGIYIMTVQVDDHALFLSFFDFMYEPNKLNKQVQCITLTTMQTR